jgi:hypothetical protein
VPGTLATSRTDLDQVIVAGWIYGGCRASNIFR